MRRNFWILFAIILLCLSCVCSVGSGQEHVVTLEDGTPLGGEGFQGVPPSYLAVVKVQTSHSGNWVGSGSFISDRLILTCYHNVRGVKKGDRVGIHTTNGTVYWKTRVTHTHVDHDLALIYIDDPKVEYHRILKVMDTPYSLRDVSLMGFKPSSNALTITGGLPTGRRFGNNGKRYPITIETTCSIVQGMSGGPMIDASLHLVGVGIQGDQKTSHVVMLKHIHSFLDSYTGPKGNVDDPWDWLRFDPSR